MKSEKRRRRSFRNKAAVSSGLSALAFILWAGIEFLTMGRDASVLPLMIAAGMLLFGSWVAFGRRRIRMIKD